MRLPHWRLYSSALFHGVLGFSADFDLAILNPTQKWVKSFCNESMIAHYGKPLTVSSAQWLWAGVSSSFIVGAMVASLTMHFPAEKLGRRYSVMVLKNLLLIPGFLLQIIAAPTNSFELLIAGRLLAGFALAYTNLIPVYLAECSPSEYRALVCCSTIGIGARFWTFTAVVLAVVSDENTWHYMSIVPLLAAVIHMAALPLFHESVKHSFITQKRPEQTRKASMFYYGSKLDAEKLKDEMEKEIDICPTVKQATLKLIWTAPQFRWPLFLCVVAYITVPISGAFISSSYSSDILQALSGSDLHEGARVAISLIVPGFALVASVAALYLLYHVGHRTLLLTGLICAFFGTILLAVTTPIQEMGESMGWVTSAAGLVLVNVGFTIGPGLIAFILPGELTAQVTRSLTTGVASFASFSLLLTVLLVFPAANQSMGSYVFVPLAALTALCAYLLFEFLPETRDKPIHDVLAAWMPLRKNATMVDFDYGTFNKALEEEDLTLGAG